MGREASRKRGEPPRRLRSVGGAASAKPGGGGAEHSTPYPRTTMTRTPRVLSIAGSDSGGGAGIQADLKAFAACGVHGMTAITAITAQSTVGVDAVQPVAPEIIVAQVRSVAEDIGVDAVKIGMLADTTTIAAVVHALDLLPETTPV